jgi:molecular chaperone DnaJ
MVKDYYKILEVDRDASIEDIKKSFKKLAFKYHPDKNQDNKESEEKFKEISEAYDTLGDKDKKTRYDHTGSFSESFDFSDIINNFFSGNNRNRSEHEIRSVELVIDLEDALYGNTVHKNIRLNKPCNFCESKGYKDQKDVMICTNCSGTGSISSRKGNFYISITCNFCKGEGIIINNPCTECKGRKSSIIDKEIEINIPAGIKSRSVIRIKIEENEFNFFININKHPDYEINGNDLLTVREIDFTDLLLGNILKIKTPWDLKDLEIKECTKSGSVFKIKDHGYSILRENRKGDLYVKVNALFPEKLNDHQVTILKEFYTK